MTYRACINFRRDAFTPPYGHAVYFWSIVTRSGFTETGQRDELFGTSVKRAAERSPFKEERVIRAFHDEKGRRGKGNENAGETHVGEHFSTMTRTNSSGRPETSGARKSSNNKRDDQTGDQPDSDTQWWLRLLVAKLLAQRVTLLRYSIDERREPMPMETSRRSGFSSRRRRLVASRRTPREKTRRGRRERLRETHSRGRSTLAATEITRSRSASAPGPGSTDIVLPRHDTHVLTVRQGRPQHRSSVVYSVLLSRRLPRLARTKAGHSYREP